MVIWCSNCQNPQRNPKIMTEITAPSAGVVNMLLSKWSVIAFSISKKAPLHSRTFKTLCNPQPSCVRGPQKRMLFYFCCLELLTKLSGGFQVYSPAMNQPFSMKSVRTQKMSTNQVCLFVCLFFDALLNDLMNVCFAYFHNPSAVHDF